MERKPQQPHRANKKPQAAEGLLTVRQVAENWQVSERTVRRMTEDGRLPVIRIGRAVRIPSGHLELEPAARCKPLK